MTKQQDESGRFPNGVVAVFGGNGGIGRGICLALAQAGCDSAKLSVQSRRCGVGHARDDDLQRRAEAVQLELSHGPAVAETAAFVRG
jgi:NAD(P)-dependent dehydrogenase (short-subunit alcohol dehydrogenase family)